MMKKLTCLLALVLLTTTTALAELPCEGRLELLGSGISEQFWTSADQTPFFLAEVTEEGQAGCEGLLSPKLEILGWGNFYVITDPFQTTLYDNEGNATEGYSATFECWACLRVFAELVKKQVTISLDEAMAAAIRLTGGDVIAVRAPTDNEDAAGRTEVGSYQVTTLSRGVLSRVTVDAESGRACRSLPINDDEEEDIECC